MKLSTKFESAINEGKLKYKSLTPSVFQINMADPKHLQGVVRNTFFINNDNNEISVRAILHKNQMLKQAKDVHMFISFWNSNFKVPKLFYNETTKNLEMEWHWFFYDFKPSVQNLKQSVMDLFFDCSYSCLKELVKHGFYAKPNSENDGKVTAARKEMTEKAPKAPHV